MSFILDALKKLEQKRQQNAVPDLLTVHAPDTVQPGKRSVWLYLFLSALFLNALLLTAWLRPWDSGKQEIAEEPAVVKRSNEDAGIKPEVSMPSIKTEEPAPLLQKPEAAVKKLPHVSGKTAAMPVKEPAPNAPMKKNAENLVQREETPYVKEAPDAGSIESHETPPLQEKHNEVTYNYQTASGERLPDLDQLPLSIRQEMPEIKLSGHIYSDSPSARLVNINGSIRREGDMVASGIKLIEITDSGVILSYKDTRFYVRGF